MKRKEHAMSADWLFIRHCRIEASEQPSCRKLKKYCKPERFELSAGSKSDNNIHLYKKLGYHIFRKTKYECGDIEIYYMEKIIKV